MRWSPPKITGIAPNWVIRRAASLNLDSVTLQSTWETERSPRSLTIFFISSVSTRTRESISIRLLSGSLWFPI